MPKFSSVIAASMALGAGSAFAADFTISASSSTPQTLGSAAGQSGLITQTGVLAVSGSTAAVLLTGNDANLTNLGTLQQTGTGRAILDSTGVKGLTVTNGSTSNSSALMQTANGDVIQMNGPASSVTLNNYGSMISLNPSGGGSQAVDFNAIQTGANVVNNFAGALLKASEADAVRMGVNGVVNNSGTILSVTHTGSSSDGVDAQSNTGVQITNSAGGLIEGGRHGITGGAANSSVLFATTVTNNVGATIQGDNGSGINLDGFNANETATIVNHGTITGNGVNGDGDGIDVDGVVNITNTGMIRSLNAASGNSEGITAGGGTIVNSGTIEGDVLAGNTVSTGRGITLAGVDTNGPKQAIYANSIITNLSGGLIKGQTDSAVFVGGPASGFTVTINNNGGATMLGGGMTTAAIQTGADNDTITNAGRIDGSSSGRAIDMGSGNNTLNIVGGAASISGAINGGIGGTNVMTMDIGTGNSFTYSGNISNFATVETRSGNVTLSGQNTYTGRTVVTGGTLTLDGANRISSSSTLQLNGGVLKLEDAGGANGQTFAGLLLSEDSTIDLGQSSLTFDSLESVISGKTLTVLDWSAASSPDYALRFVGDESTDAAFLALLNGTTIDGLAATYRFDGTYTDVSAVPLPAGLPLLVSGLGLFAMGNRYRKAKMSIQPH
jgi:autotransporter-associated beta strand protein